MGIKGNQRQRTLKDGKQQYVTYLVESVVAVGSVVVVRSVVVVESVVVVGSA